MKGILLAIWALALSAAAQNLTVPIMVYTAANIADGISTISVPKGFSEYESPYLYGRHPTAKSYFLPAFGIEGLQIFIAWKCGKSENKWIRRAGKVQLWLGAADHTQAFVQNVATIPY